MVGGSQAGLGQSVFIHLRYPARSFAQGGCMTGHEVEADFEVCGHGSPF
jgi:hypothetical protein